MTSSRITPTTFLSPLLLACTLPLAACAMDAGASGTETAEQSSAALSNVGGATITSPSTDLKLGLASQETCFLQGVGGDFTGNPAYYETPNQFLAASAGVVEESDGFWHIKLAPGTGTGVSAEAICIAQTANRIAFSWQDNITTGGVPATPNRQCFLQTVWATSGLFNNSFNETDNVTIEEQGGYFDLNSSFVTNDFGDMNFGGATAVCVDIPHGATWNYQWNAAVGGAPLLVTGTPVGSGIACGLTQILGKWVWTPPSSNPNEKDPFGIEDGVFLSSWNAAKGAPLPFWQLTSTNGRGGHVLCLE